MENNENLEHPQEQDYRQEQAQNGTGGAYGNQAQEDSEDIPGDQGANLLGNEDAEDDDISGDANNNGGEEEEEDMSGDLAGNASGNEDADEQ